MTLRSLFNISHPAVHHGVALKDGNVAPGPTYTGVINAKQSAITFGGGPVLVTLMWKVLGAAIPEWEDSKLCALILSLLVGVVIYAMSEQPSGTLRDRFLGYVYAFINSFAIAATVMGIESTIQ